MTRNIYHIALWAECLLLAACYADHGLPEETTSAESREMRLYSETTATRTEGEESSADSPVFLFWDFGDVLANAAEPTPLHVKQPGQHIDTYRRPNAPYNTGELYPDGNRRVMATGYAPATLQPAQRQDGTKDYEHLTLGEDDTPCGTDLLTSITPIVASASLPFDRADGETLRFMHAQSLVHFEARQTNKTTGGNFFRHVRIALNKDAVATGMKWDRNISRYVPVAQGTEGYTVAQAKDAPQLTPQQAATVARHTSYPS